ncbi:TRL-like family protein [Desulfosarcina sp. OttesenSCG-928-A07]|nr:TRL-like family protein [Desulfosarcina sp. OttesenSCG-928-G17]MDL2328489.1 TRL-like family protein [Desulfosarcina sp. OttesenSCG-928-A07]
MNRLHFIVMVTLMALLVGLAGCAYVNVKSPLDVNLNQTQLGTKIGTAEARSVLWLFAWGDASYATAAKNGGITTIRHSDQEVFTVFFGLYSRWRVVVYGD